MKLNLKKPLIVFDLETTGLDMVKDRIIQISYIKVSPDGTETRKNLFVNPEKEIPAEVIALTGISNEDVKDAPTFKQLAATLDKEFTGCDFAGYNSNHFDIPMLAEEFLRAGIDFDFSKCRLIDAQTIFMKMERRNLAAAYKFFCGRKMEEDFEAHRADQDTEATYRVLMAELDKYAPGVQDEPERVLNNDMDELAAFSKQNDNVDFAGRIVWQEVKDADGNVMTDEKGEPLKHEVFNFGKYKGWDVGEILTRDPGYFTWVLGSDFTNNTKQVLTVFASVNTISVWGNRRMLKGKKIVLGITGSIAAYKSCLIIRGLIKKGAEVQVVITPAGKEFITPITLSALTHKPVVSEFFSRRDGTWNSHVDLGLWADAMLIAPCTASTMGKMAHGIADNMLITTYLSMKAPVFIAPAMDLDMYKHPSTQANMKTLLGYGNHIIEPEVGFLASGLEGKGRMEEPDIIVEYLERFFSKQEDLKGKKVMITAGPTYEKIDPVRFIGNYSSGKMGFALAEECLRRGANVTLIAGPVALSCSPGINRIDVESCEEMYQASTLAFQQADAAILCAAVADFKPNAVADRKIKREKDDLELRLVPTHDIAAALGQMKQKNQRIVAFALETNDEEANAQKKRQKKNADFIVLNSTRNPGTTFRTDDNQITIISEKGKKEYEKKPKTEVAKDIINELAKIL